MQRETLLLVIFISLSLVEAVLYGRQARPEELPFAVGIMRHYEWELRWCSGTLISAHYVLTSSKCITNLKQATILLGASDVNNPAQRVMADEIYWHRLYEPSKEVNDIGLIRLLKPANLSHPEIGVVRLPSRAQAKNSFSKELSTVFGWGYQGKKGDIPMPFLHTANESTITNAACLSRYPAYIYSTNICTSTGSGTACDGDEGGALLLVDEDGEYTQIGVNSYQFSGGCSWGWPSVHTRVTSYLDWIQANSDVVIRDE